MNVLITGRTMTYLSGQPLYCYELAKELKHKGHTVTVISEWANNELYNNLKQQGVKCVQSLKKDELEYDVIFASEWYPPVVKGKIINIVHSEYDCETPIQAHAWVCIRPSIQDHIVNEHGIPNEKTTVIYNGIDTERFYPIKIQNNEFKKIVIPCTRDRLRERFLNKMIRTANKNRIVIIIGDDYGADLIQSPYRVLTPSTFNIQKHIQTADEGQVS